VRSSFAGRLRAGDRLLGTVLTVADPVLAELACAPFDFAWIDLEHGALGARDVAALAVAARAAGCAALVRVPRVDSDLLTGLLDAGVDGVVAPRVVSAVEVARLALGMRYPPDGTRGFAHRRASDYGRGTRPPATPACMVQIESGAAVEAAVEIAAVAGVDVLVVGIADLALDLGAAPELDDPHVVGALRAVRDAADAAGIAWGVAAGGDPGAVAKVGARLVVYSADVRIYAAAIDQAAAGVRAALARR
jgi:2-keto-3-deoxy-L-rhamnonate aldolase RhmA